MNSSSNEIFLCKSSTALKFYVERIKDVLIPFPDASFSLKAVSAAKSLLSLDIR